MGPHCTPFGQRQAAFSEPLSRRSIPMLAIAMAILVQPLKATDLQVPFTEEAVARGVGYVMQNYPLTYGYVGFGCGFVDLDGDGDQDLVLMGALDGRVGIFENTGGGQFADRSIGNGIPLLLKGSAFASADYDGDGDMDLYFTQVDISSQTGSLPSPNFLLRNDGNFRFTDVTAAAGVGDPGDGKGANFGDYDNDGWLDLYVSNYTYPPTTGIRNRLYRNLGNGTFVEVGELKGVDDNGMSFQAVWFDYDRDGDVDLYLSNDRGHISPFLANRLWRNDNGRFTDVSAESGAGLALYSMGLACGDFDRNGWPDIYLTNIPPGGGYDNPLLLNQGDGTFIESTTAAGTNGCNSWGCIFFDYDNNGHQDLYVNCMFLPNRLYRNNGEYPVVDVAGTLNVMGTGSVSFASAVGDVDGDGDLDLLVNNCGGNVQLFINNEGQSKSWVKLRMVGENTNTHAVGSRVDLRIGTDWQLREVLAGGNGYLGQNDLDLHFGLGTATSVDEIVASWPGGGTTRIITGLPANQTWHLYPPQRLGDSDADGNHDLNDYAQWPACQTGPDVPMAAGCEIFDFTGDSRIDLRDFAAFAAAMER